MKQQKRTSTLAAGIVIIVISAIRWLRDSQGARVIGGCEGYIEDHIPSLSPIDAVLGGTRYVTDIQSSGDIYEVSYEDGHIAAIAHIHCTLENDEAKIHDITLLDQQGEK